MDEIKLREGFAKFAAMAKDSEPFPGAGEFLCEIVARIVMDLHRIANAAAAIEKEI